MFDEKTNETDSGPSSKFTCNLPSLFAYCTDEMSLPEHITNEVVCEHPQTSYIVLILPKPIDFIHRSHASTLSNLLHSCQGIHR